jgi:hypothetical protein
VQQQVWPAYPVATIEPTLPSGTKRVAGCRRACVLLEMELIGGDGKGKGDARQGKPSSRRHVMQIRSRLRQAAGGGALVDGFRRRARSQLVFHHDAQQAWISSSLQLPRQSQRATRRLDIHLETVSTLTTPSGPYTTAQSEYGPVVCCHVGCELTVLCQEDGSKCSIFSFDITANKSRLPLARNALRKLRTLRHPGVVKVLDTAEVLAVRPALRLQR